MNHIFHNRWMSFFPDREPTLEEAAEARRLIDEEQVRWLAEYKFQKP